MQTKIPIIEELEKAQAWIDSGVDGWAGTTIVKRLMMVIRFLLADIEQMERQAKLEDGWSEK